MKHIKKVLNCLFVVVVIEKVQYERKFFSRMEYEVIKSMVEREVDITHHSSTSIFNERFYLKLFAAVAGWSFSVVVILNWFHDIFRQSGLLLLTGLLLLQAIFFSFNFIYYCITFLVADEERIRYIRIVETLVLETHNYEQFSLLIQRVLR